MGLAIIIFLAAYGSGSSGGDGSNGVTVSNETPYVLSSTPSDGAQDVTPLQELTVTFSTDMDESTVTFSAFVLKSASSLNLTVIVCSVTYDVQTSTATVTLLKPLLDGLNHVLEISAVTNIYGTPIVPTIISFRTSRNPDSMRIYYDSSGDITLYYAVSSDANCLTEESVLYEKPGADSLWFTSDDVISGYTEFSYDADGPKTYHAHYSGPGIDAQWFTSDDHVSYGWEY